MVAGRGLSNIDEGRRTAAGLSASGVVQRPALRDSLPHRVEISSNQWIVANRRVHVMLKCEGWAVGQNVVYRLYREEGFLLHVLPRGFHRIRHYGLLVGSTRKQRLARACELLSVVPPPDDEMPEEPRDVRPPCDGHAGDRPA